MDAKGCQKDIAKEIREADADYVLPLKGNHGTAFAEIKSSLDEAIQRNEKHLVTTATVDKGHGRVEERRYWQTEKLDGLPTGPSGNACAVSAWWRRYGRSTGRRTWNGAIT